MKKYMVFVVSFLLLFSLFIVSAEVLSGMYLTSAYTPDIKEAWNANAALPQQTVILSTNSSFLLTLVPALLSATIAYFLSQTFSKRTHNKVE